MDKQYKNNEYGDYSITFSSEEDEDEMVFFMKLKKYLPKPKNEAVYYRNEVEFISSISKRLFVIIRRKPTNEKEECKLDMKKTDIVAIVGAYSLPNNNEVESKRIIEIGTLLYLYFNDLPNADNQYPHGAFFNILVSLAIMNLVCKAGQEVGGQKLEFETIVCNVQNHLTGHRAKLEGRPFYWKMIKDPYELEKMSAKTTVNSEDFHSYDKSFFELPPSSLPDIAKFILDCFRKPLLTSDIHGIQNIVHIYPDIDEAMISFLKDVCNSKVLFEEGKWLGYTSLRSQLSDVVI